MKRILIFCLFLMRSIVLGFFIFGIAANIAIAEDSQFDANALAQAFELSKSCAQECSNQSVNMVRLQLPQGKTGFLITTRDSGFCGSGGCSSAVVVVAGTKFVTVKEGLGITKNQAVALASGTGDAASLVSGGPSFDCAKATTAAARLICGDTELTDADNKLAKKFREATGQADQWTKKQLLEKEVGWLRERNKQCGVGPDKAKVPVDQLKDAKECMLGAISERIAELNGRIGAGVSYDPAATEFCTSNYERVRAKATTSKEAFLANCNATYRQPAPQGPKTKEACMAEANARGLHGREYIEYRDKCTGATEPVTAAADDASPFPFQKFEVTCRAYDARASTYAGNGYSNIATVILDHAPAMKLADQTVVTKFLNYVRDNARKFCANDVNVRKDGQPAAIDVGTRECSTCPVGFAAFSLDGSQWNVSINYYPQVKADEAAKLNIPPPQPQPTYSAGSLEAGADACIREAQAAAAGGGCSKFVRLDGVTVTDSLEMSPTQRRAQIIVTKVTLDRILGDSGTGLFCLGTTDHVFYPPGFRFVKRQTLDLQKWASGWKC